MGDGQKGKGTNWLIVENEFCGRSCDLVPNSQFLELPFAVDLFDVGDFERLDLLSVCPVGFGVNESSVVTGDPLAHPRVAVIVVVVPLALQDET